MCPSEKELRRFSSEMAGNPNRFSESEPLLRTHINETQKQGCDMNKKICGFYVNGPDGVRACWVALAAFLISFITAGVGRVYGILLPHLLTEFGIDREMASLPFSLQLALRNLFGPFVGILGHKFGVQKITFIGAVISAASTAVCCWASLYIWVIVSWGCITGIGVSLCTSLLQLTVGEYFVKNKASAMGVSLAGGCLGSIAFPPVVELLLQSFHLKIVFLWMGGILALAIPFSSAFKEPPWAKKQSQSIEIYEYLDSSRGISSLENSLRITHATDCGTQDDSASVCTMKTIPQNMPNITFLRKHKELFIKLLRRATILELKTSENDKLNLENSIRISMEDLFQYIDDFLRNLRNKIFLNKDYLKQSLKPIPVSYGANLMEGEHTSIPLIDFSEGSNESKRSSVIRKLEKITLMPFSELLAVCPNESKHDILNISIELRNLCNAAICLEKQENALLFLNGSEQDDHFFREDSNSKCHRLVFLMKSIWEHSKSSWKPVFLLYKNPLFLFISICRLAHFITFCPVLVTIVDFLMEKGLPEFDGQYGVISLSIGDFAGRTCTGWVTDKGYLCLPKFMAIVMLCQCVSTTTLPFIHNRYLMFAALVVFGLLQGSNFVRHPVLISNYMDKKEQPFAMGCLSFFSGIFACVMPLYIGLCKDTIGTYNIMFYISGCIGACIGLIWFLIRNCEAFRPVEETASEPDENV